MDITIDRNLSFKNHANLVESKTCYALSFVHRYKRMLSPRNFALYVNTYVHSLSDYCLSIWCVNNSYINYIQSKINNLLITFNFPKYSLLFRKSLWASKNASVSRKLAKLRREFRTVNLFGLLDKHNLLTLSERLTCFTLMNVYKAMKRRTIISECFVSSARRSDLLIVPKHSLKFYESNFVYRGVLLWNNLPSSLKNKLISVDHFRLLLYDYIKEQRS